MQIHYTIIDTVGNVHNKGLISGSAEDVLKRIFSISTNDRGSGRAERDVADAYNLFDLNGLSFTEVMKRVEQLVEADDNNAEVLFLTELADDVGDFFEELRALFNADVGADYVEVTEEQTTILVKIS